MNFRAPSTILTPAQSLLAPSITSDLVEPTSMWKSLRRCQATLCLRAQPCLDDSDNAGGRKQARRSAVMPIERVFAVGRSGRGIDRVPETVNQYTPEVKSGALQELRDVLERTSVVITATDSPTPVLPDEPMLLDDKRSISIGSYRPSMQELPDSVYRAADLHAIDSQHTIREVGDVINPLIKGILARSRVVSIGDYVLGQRAFDETQNIVYKSVGASFYDLFVSRGLYGEAKSRGIGKSDTPVS